MKPYSTDDSNMPSRTKHLAAQKTLPWYKWLFAAALCASPMVSLPASAQSQWTNSDAFQLAQGFSSEGVGLGTNELGNIIAAGSGSDASGNYAVTRQSSDLGQTWQPASTVSFAGTSGCRFNAVANHGPTLYAGGSASGPTWIITQSSDGGDNWQLSDSFQSGACMALAVDSSGAAFATGQKVVNGQLSFIIRKLSPGAAGWTTVYQSQVPSYPGYGIAIHPSAGVFVIGSLPQGTQYAWAVLRSIDEGNSWQVVDLNLPPRTPGTGSYGHGIAVDNLGNVYATGTVGNDWVTRRSTNGGTNWNTIDTFQYFAKFGKSEGASVSFDYQGNVYVAGYGATSKQAAHWIVRKLPAGGSSWTISDDFQLVSGALTEPWIGQSSILSANAGHLLLVTGDAFDSSSVQHWITRRLVVP